MFYPSGIHYGIPGYLMPLAHPYEIFRFSLKRAAQRTGLSPKHFRPWLQAFRDYGFDKRAFGLKRLRRKSKPPTTLDHGWMLWNPHNVYSADGLAGTRQSDSSYTHATAASRLYIKSVGYHARQVVSVCGSINRGIGSGRSH